LDGGTVQRDYTAVHDGFYLQIEMQVNTAFTTLRFCLQYRWQ
jgi:hypothetical protein